jgi:hypothetical protein
METSSNYLLIGLFLLFSASMSLIDQCPAERGGDSGLGQ